MRIRIPFRPHFKDAIITGRKIATSRTTKYGSPGDEFEAFGYVFVIERQERISLGVVTHRHYEAEGFATPEQFKNEWISLHPERGYEPEQKVWMHWFHRKGVRHMPHFVPEEKQMELGRSWLTDKDITQRIEGIVMARMESIVPSKLFTHLLDPEWLERRGIMPGSANVIHIYHDDGCPCEIGVAGLPSCTCELIDYDIEPIEENLTP